MLLKCRWKGMNIKPFEIKEGLNLFFQDSGVGKSFLFNIVRHNLIEEKKSFLFINSMSDLSGSSLRGINEEYEYALLDDADLYLEKQGVLDIIMTNAKYVLVSSKSLKYYSKYKIYFHRINRDENSLEVKLDV